MISKQYIKYLEFNTLEEFFNYIVESEINGNYSQTKQFIKRLSGSQFLSFLQWLEMEEYSNVPFIYMRHV